MPSTPQISPIDPFKAFTASNPVEKAMPPGSEKVDKFMKDGRIFVQPRNPQAPVFKVSVGIPQNTFLGLADLLEIDHSEKMMGFLKDYTDNEFIDEINAFKHLPIISIALKQITQNFKKWDMSNEHSELEETLTNQFKNLALLIDILTDILPEAGEKIVNVRDTPELHAYLAGDEPIGDEMAFKIRDLFRSQINQKAEPK